MSNEHGFAKGRTSTGSGSWRTPPDVLADLQAIAGWAPWGLDLAASSINRVADAYVGPDHADPTRRDALAAPTWLLGQWAGAAPVWCNPPYDKWADFARVLIALAALRSVRSCLLVFARTDTVAWHDVAPCASALAFRAGRVAFVDPATGARGGSAPAPSVALFFGPPWTGRRGVVSGAARWHVVTP